MADGFDLGGGGGNAFSWGPVGTQPGGYVQGTVVDMKEVQSTNFSTKEPEFWDNGDPKMQYRVTLQTETRDQAIANDDGKRDIYLDGRRRANENGTKSKLCAVLDAVRETTGGTSLQPGGKLTLQWISGVGVTGDPRCFQAWYEAPVMQLGQPGATPPGVSAPAAAVQAPPAAPSQTVQQTIEQQAATGQQPPAFAQPQQVAPATGVPAGAGIAHPANGTLSPPISNPPVAAQAGPSPEQIAALKAANIDPATVFPGWVDPAAQPVG